MGCSLCAVRFDGTKRTKRDRAFAWSANEFDIGLVGLPVFPTSKTESSLPMRTMRLCVTRLTATRARGVSF